MKKTHRKGFNFFRSYFDVFNELPEEDKLPFIEALLNKQFLGEEPTSLKGMAKFAWISQQHSISEQVKGYETKTKTKLTPTVGVDLPPTEQVQVEEKGEVKEEVQCVTQDQFLESFNSIRISKGLKSNIKRLGYEEMANLKLLDTYTLKDFEYAINNCLGDKWVTDNNQGFPKHFLKVENFTKYLNMEAKRKPISEMSTHEILKLR